MGEFTPLSDNPTLAELGKSSQQLHACLEGHITKTTAEFADVKRQQGLMMLALGVDPHMPDATRPARTVASMTPGQLTWRIAAVAGAAVAALEAWRWAARLLPVAWSALLQLNHIIVFGN